MYCEVKDLDTGAHIKFTRDQFQEFFNNQILLKADSAFNYTLELFYVRISKRDRRKVEQFLGQK